MTNEQIKVMFSKEILHFGDKAAETTLRRILFTPRNNIDWQDAYRIALDDMPELKNYKPEH